MADEARPEVKAGEQTSLNPVIRLWPDGPPSSLPGVGPETTFISQATPRTTMLRNVSDPSLTVFAPAPAKANGVGVIVCPGGAWRVLAWEHEGITPARWLAARGYTAFLLKYRLRGSPPDPVEFAEAVAKMAASMPTVVPGAKAPRWQTRCATRALPARGKSPPTMDAARSRSFASGRPSGGSSRTGSEWSAFPPASF